MVLTNALLSIGFSIVANFTNVVPVPATSLPTRLEDLATYTVGGVFSPIDLCLVHRSGTFFDVTHGVVSHFVTPGAYSHLQDPALIPKFCGKPLFTSNEVFSLAVKVVARAARGTNPITSLKPHVNYAGKFKGKEIPFYDITWTIPRNPGIGYASIEIDARTGDVVSLQLLEPSFYDGAGAAEIRKAVYRPEPKPTPRVGGSSRVLPCPTRQDAARCLHSLARFCAMLDLPPPADCNLAAVDWRLTCLYTNRDLSVSTPISKIAFTNGAVFRTLGLTTYSYLFPGACFTWDWARRSPEDWFAFEGPIRKDWKELAQRLQARVQERLSLPSELLNGYQKALRVAEPRVGEFRLKRVLVDWVNGEPRIQVTNGVACVWDDNLGFSAEFDLETGDLEGLTFRSTKLIEALAKAQLRAPTSRSEE